MKVIIKQWTAVAAWHWDMPEDDVCGICRVQFDGTCPTCKYPGDDCALLVGKCSHAFHMHCLLGWIQQEQSKGLCPMCRQKFEWEQSDEDMEGQSAEGEEEQDQGDGEVEEGMEDAEGMEYDEQNHEEDTTDEIETVG